LTRSEDRERATGGQAAYPGGDAPAEKVLEGLAVSGGIAVGPAYIVENGGTPVPEYVILRSEVEAEVRRLNEASTLSVRQIDKLKAKARRLPVESAEELTALLDAHRAILSGSRLLRGAEARIRDRLSNAAWAVSAEMRAVLAHFDGMQDRYLASRVRDIEEVGNRLIRNLQAEKYRAFSDLEPGSVILAEDITPADTALMDPVRVAGFAAASGGAQGHTAIMARSLGLPAVLGVGDLLAHVSPGDTVVVDGEKGLLIVNPKPATLAGYEARRRALDVDAQRLKLLTGLPSVTLCGTPVALNVNVELPRDMARAIESGADGVGLFRTEFLFMNRDDLPEEEEQYEALRRVVEAMQGRPVTIRTLDVGGEKLAPSLGRHFAEVDNPALGLRAIRLSLRRKELLATQLAAILRAGTHGPVRVLLPMVTAPAEVRTVRKAMAVVARRLERAGVAVPDPLPPIGAMIEVPAAAIAAAPLAACADFFAIGTNDLTMYTLAADRADDQVASYYDPMHPAVLRLLAMAVDAAAGEGIPVSICGEIAGDPALTPLLLGLGLRDLSMAPSSLLSVRRVVRDTRITQARAFAQVVLAQSESAQVHALIAAGPAEVASAA